MLKDVKLGFQLLKYSYKVKVNVVSLIIFLAIGLIVEIMSRGTNIVGGIYIMLVGVFTYQMIMSMDISQMIQASSMKRKLQIDLPVLSSTVVYLLIYTVLVIERAILIKSNPEQEALLVFTLFMVVVTMVAVFFFASICYKYFIFGMILFITMYIALCCAFNLLWMNGLSDKILRLGFVKISLLGYIVIFRGAGLEIFLGNLLYKKPLSEFAFRGIFRDAK